MIKKLFDWFIRKRTARAEAVMFERHVIVRFDDNGISAAYPDGSVESVLWSDVDRIAIHTNDSGPWGADVWWLVEGKRGRCVYPQGATGDQEALAEYQKRFSGFDDAAVIAAMGCTSNARFVCWPA